MTPLTVAQAAERKGVTSRRIRALCESGRLPAQKVGRDWLIDPRALERLKPGKPGRPKNPPEG